jgi:hypothetical protein
MEVPGIEMKAKRLHAFYSRLTERGTGGKTKSRRNPKPNQEKSNPGIRSPNFIKVLIAFNSRLSLFCDRPSAGDLICSANALKSLDT